MSIPFVNEATNMALFLLSYLASAYIFSGFVCRLAVLKNSKQQFGLAHWQQLLAGLASFFIVMFWPLWIIVDVRNTEQPKLETVSLSRFIIISSNTLEKESLSKDS